LHQWQSTRHFSFDGKWEIQGRDVRGENIHVAAITGAVIKVDRD